jgi:hypothetical protein
LFGEVNIGIDRFIFSSCALVVVGSDRRAFIEGRLAKFLCRRLGVDDAAATAAVAREGVDGVGMLVVDE